MHASRSFLSPFKPKLLTVLQEGYKASDLRSDLVSGLTVAIVALPLSMAIAIASGASPASGLVTSVVGGFLVSLLGGSRHQIGGPAGAFIVLVSTTVALHGMEGLILATFLSGIIMVLAGFLRLGAFIKYIPFPVTVGFTAGIAVIILLSQLKDLFGLSLASEPNEVLPRLQAFWAVRDSFTPEALALGLFAIAAIFGLRQWKPRLPSMLVVVILSSLVAALLGLPVETIGSAYGGIPSSFPSPTLPVLDFDLVLAVLPAALSFALLGSIESLLSAVIADGMSGGKHRSNAEILAQGVANMGSALFGGFCVTGTIARTATNVRSGAKGPLSGIFHSLFLLAFMLLAAPLASYIPLATLAGLLVVVAWNMIERPSLAMLLRTNWGEVAVLNATFLLTVFKDLTQGIIVGLALGSILFIRRMSQATSVTSMVPFVSEDEEDLPLETLEKRLYQNIPEHVGVFYISGALFFGASSAVASVLAPGNQHQNIIIVDISRVPFLDATGGQMLLLLSQKLQAQGKSLWLTGANKSLRPSLERFGLHGPEISFYASVNDALFALEDESPSAKWPLMKPEDSL